MPFRMVQGVPYGLRTGRIHGKKIGLCGTLQRDFIRNVDCRTGELIIAKHARSAVILGSEGIVLGDLGFKFLYRIEREEFVAGRVTTEQLAEVGENRGFGVDGGGNKLAPIIGGPGIDD